MKWLVSCRPALATTCLVLTLSASALQADETINLPFKAEAGDEYRLTVQRTEKRLKGDDPVSQVETNAAYDARIVEKLSEGYVMAWKQTAYDRKVLEDKTGAEAQKAETQRAISESLRNLEISFETNAAGVPVRIVGWSEVSKTIAVAFREHLKKGLIARLEGPALAAGKTKEEVEAAAQAQVDAVIGALILRHDERTAVVLLEEALLVAGVQNQSLPLGKKVDWSAVAPSLLSEQGVSYESIGALERLDKATSEAEITWTNTYNPDQLRAQALDLIKNQLAASKQVPQDKVDEILSTLSKLEVSRVDTGKALIGIEDGWTRSVEYVKRVNSRLEPALQEYQEKTVRIVVSR